MAGIDGEDREGGREKAGFGESGEGGGEGNGDGAYRVRQDGWTAARRGKYLRALARTGCVRDACRAANISSTSAYRMRRRDARFAAEWHRAIEDSAPGLEAAAYSRAVEGVEEPVVSCGKVVTTRRRYSDSLLRMLIERGDLGERLKGHAGLLTPEEYRAGLRFDEKNRKVQARSADAVFEEFKQRLAEIRRRKDAAPAGEVAEEDAEVDAEESGNCGEESEDGTGESSAG